MGSTCFQIFLLPFPCLAHCSTGNSHACQSSVRYNVSSPAALRRAAIGGPANGDGLRNTLESLTLAWVKMPRKAVRDLTDCLFGAVQQEEEERGGGGGGGGARQGFHFDSKMQDASPPSSSSSAGTGTQRYFPSLVAFGLIQREIDRGDGGALTQYAFPFSSYFFEPVSPGVSRMLTSPITALSAMK